MIFKISNNIYGFQIRIRILEYNFNLRINKNYHTTKTLGIRNNTLDGKRIIFLDFDNHLLEQLKTEITYLQKRYQLSDLYIFRSSQNPHSYHVICLDKLDYNEWIRLLNETTCDPFYKTMPITNDYKNWVLRILPKKDSVAPKLIKVLTSRFHWRRKSKAHWLFLKKHHKIKKKPKNLDNLNEIYTTNYDTLNYHTMKLKKNNEKVFKSKKK